MYLRFTLVYIHANTLSHFHSFTSIITRTHTLSPLPSFAYTRPHSLIFSTHSLSYSLHTLFHLHTLSLSHTHHVHFLLLRFPSGADGADHRAGEQQQEAGEPSAARTVSKSLCTCMCSARTVSESLCTCMFTARTMSESLCTCMFTARTVSESLCTCMCAARTVSESLCTCMFTARTVNESLCTCLCAARTVSESLCTCVHMHTCTHTHCEIHISMYAYVTNKYLFCTYTLRRTPICEFTHDVIQIPCIRSIEQHVGW